MTNYTDPKYQKSNAKFKGHPDFQAKKGLKHMIQIAKMENYSHKLQISDIQIPIK
jgi:hypothetical protein